MYLILLLFIILFAVSAYYTKEFFTKQTAINYNNQIADRVRPPNVYMTNDMQYTPETVMAELNDVRQTVDRYNAQLPNIIATELAKKNS